MEQEQKRSVQRQRASLSGRTWGRPRTEKQRIEETRHAYEGACFQAYQFDHGLGLNGGASWVDVKPSAACYGLCTGDKTLAWHVEKLLDGCYGLTLDRTECGWPW